MSEGATSGAVASNAHTGVTPRWTFLAQLCSSPASPGLCGAPSLFSGLREDTSGVTAQCVTPLVRNGRESIQTARHGRHEAVSAAPFGAFGSRKEQPGLCGRDLPQLPSPSCFFPSLRTNARPSAHALSHLQSGRSSRRLLRTEEWFARSPRALQDDVRLAGRTRRRQQRGRV